VTLVPQSGVRSELAALLGESKVTSEPAACAAFAVDGKSPACVVYPPSPEQVAALLRYAADHELAVLPCRNATKLDTGNPPQRYDIALSLKELNQVWHYEPADLTISVEPGMKFGDFQYFVARHRLWLPLDPRGGAKASLGGIVATNSAGPLRLRYGSPRDMVLGLKVATTEGKIIKTGGRVVKNVAGYDLGKLLVGSYGSLGVIVEASLKLFPLPAERATFILRAGTLATARDLRRRILHSPLDPLRLTLLDPWAATLVRAGSREPGEAREHEVWIEVGGSTRVIERCEQEVRDLGRAAGSPPQRLARTETGEAEKFWARIADPAAWLKDAYPDGVVLRTTLPIASTEEFLNRAQQEVESESVGLAGLAQVGTGMVTLCLLEPKRAREFSGLVLRLRRAAEDLGGALIVEHCPWEFKSGIEAWGSAGDHFEVMRRVKGVWDPKGILSPGRFLGGL
jgi:glycolate oxidase FAD binding subunit